MTTNTCRNPSKEAGSFYLLYLVHVDFWQTRNGYKYTILFSKLYSMFSPDLSQVLEATIYCNVEVLCTTDFHH